MKKILKNLALRAMIAGTIITSSCDKNLRNDHLLPEAMKNQELILDPNYINGRIPLGYTLLTDLDEDGKWDLARSVYAGSGPGSWSVIDYYKEGYEEGQFEDLQSTYQTHFVKSEFFDKYPTPR